MNNLQTKIIFEDKSKLNDFLSFVDSLTQAMPIKKLPAFHISGDAIILHVQDIKPQVASVITAIADDITDGDLSFADYIDNTAEDLIQFGSRDEDDQIIPEYTYAVDADYFEELKQYAAMHLFEETLEELSTQHTTARFTAQVTELARAGI
jgi:hypothetical protein